MNKKPYKKPKNLSLLYKPVLDFFLVKKPKQTKYTIKLVFLVQQPYTEKRTFIFKQLSKNTINVILELNSYRSYHPINDIVIILNQSSAKKRKSKLIYPTYPFFTSLNYPRPPPSASSFLAGKSQILFRHSATTGSASISLLSSCKS